MFKTKLRSKIVPLVLVLIFCLFCLTACQLTPVEPENTAETQVPALRSEYDALQKKYDALQAEWEELYRENQSLRALLDYHVVEISELTTPMFAPDTVEAHGLPLEESAVIGTYCNALVEILLTIRHQEDLWSMVFLYNPAENMDTVGWISWNELVPYDPATMESQLVYPVRVKTGTLLRDEVRGCERIEDGSYAYLVEYTETDVVMILDSGGIRYPVTRDDLIYPSVQDGKIVWEQH